MKLSVTAAEDCVSYCLNAPVATRIIKTYQSPPKQASGLEKTRTEAPEAFGVTLSLLERYLPVSVPPVVGSCLQYASSRTRHRLRYFGRRTEGELRPDVE